MPSDGQLRSCLRRRSKLWRSTFCSDFGVGRTDPAHWKILDRRNKQLFRVRIQSAHLLPDCVSHTCLPTLLKDATDDNAKDVRTSQPTMPQASSFRGAWPNGNSSWMSLPQPVFWLKPFWFHRSELFLTPDSDGYHRVVKRDPDQPEFHQVLWEVLSSYSSVFKESPEYVQIVEAMVEPERVIHFRMVRRCGQVARQSGLQGAVQQHHRPVQGGA